MKKIALLLFVFVTCLACETDIKSNTPAMQGKVDNAFWKAIDMRATIASNGSVTITGLARDQKMELRVPSRNLGVHQLGSSNSRNASFTQTIGNEDILFTTGNGIDGSGEIRVTEFDAEAQTISGTFRFNAINADNHPMFGESLYCNEGTFYKVPIVSN